LAGDRPNDRDHAPQLLLERNGLRTWARGLPAHIDDAGPLLDHGECALERARRIQELATVTEGIGRHVEHAHDYGLLEREGAARVAPVQATRRGLVLQCWPAGVPIEDFGRSTGSTVTGLPPGPPAVSSHPSGGLGLRPAMMSLICV